VKLHVNMFAVFVPFRSYAQLDVDQLNIARLSVTAVKCCFG